MLPCAAMTSTMVRPMGRALTAAILLSTLSTAAHAVSIGVDWFGGAGSPLQSQMQLSELAGVVPQTNWNGFTGTGQLSPQSLLDSSGSASGATITWTGSS